MGYVHWRTRWCHRKSVNTYKMYQSYTKRGWLCSSYQNIGFKVWLYSIVRMYITNSSGLICRRNSIPIWEQSRCHLDDRFHSELFWLILFTYVAQILHKAFLEIHETIILAGKAWICSFIVSTALLKCHFVPLFLNANFGRITSLYRTSFGAYFYSVVCIKRWLKWSW